MTPVDRLTWAYFRSINAQSHWVMTEYGKQHALEVKGQGQNGTIILLHGLSARSTHFAFMVRKLRPHFGRLIIPDMLGHGRNPAPDCAIGCWDMQRTANAVLNELVPEPAVVYGNSLGGYGAISFAAKHPQRVRALIVNSPGGGALQSMSMQDYMNRFRPQTKDDARTFVDLYFGKNLPLKRLLAFGVTRQLNEPFVKAFMSELTNDDFLRADQLQCLAMPCLFLWGQRDQIMHPEQLDFFKQNLPNHVQIEEPVTYGHAPYIEHPYDLSARLMTFVNENLANAA